MRDRLPVIQERSCGDCHVCCVTARIDELDKPARVACQHLDASGCTIYVDRPGVCAAYQCTWRRGFGRQEDRPDLIGAMMFVHVLNGGRFVFVIETVSGAVVGDAASLIAEAALFFQLPVVISDAETLPPHDTGDRVAVHAAIAHRARFMTGERLADLAPAVSLHRLVA